MSDETERNKIYWVRGRLIATIAWIALLFVVPFGLEALEVLPAGAGFIPFFLILVLGVGVFVDKPALRVGVCLVVIFSLGVLFKPDGLALLLDGLNYRMQDHFFKVRGPKEPTGQVVICDIDDKSLRELGQWPWPRTEIARAVANLKADGARVIGFDVVFAEPDRLSLKEWADRLTTMGLGLVAPNGANESNANRSRVLAELTGFRISPDIIKDIVLEDWEEHLSRLNKKFTIPPDLPAAEREAAIIAAYLDYSRAWWDEEQETSFRRAERAGFVYRKRPFPESDDPLLAMARASKELFFLRSHLSSRVELENGAPVIADNDQELGEVFRDTLTVAGGLFVADNNTGSRVSSYRKHESLLETEGMVVSTAILNAEEVFPGIRSAVRQIVNVPEVQRMIYHQGMFNIVPDQSGAARYYTMLMNAPVFQESLVLKPEKATLGGAALLDPSNYDTKIVSQTYTYPSLVLEMLRAANGYDEIQVGFKDGHRGIFLKRERGFPYARGRGFQADDMDPTKPGQYYSKDMFSYLLPKERFIPLDFKGDILVNYLGYGGRWQPENHYGPSYHFPYYSLTDVIKKQFIPGTFKDKYVLVGSTDPTLSDLVGSPFRPAFPGLEVHATVLDNLISGDLIIDFEQTTVILMFFGILFGGTLLTALMTFTPVWVDGISIAAVLLGLPAVSYWGLAHGHYIFDFVYPWLCTAGIVGSVTLVNFFLEGRDRRFVASQFSKMVSPDLLHKLRDDPKGVSLAGERADISVMFSDIAGFTTISERLQPKVLVDLLNDYLTPMSDIIMKHDGFIDKYIGDAIMGVWGVPFRDENHARKACIAALEQQEALREVMVSLEAKYDAKISVRMGIASGEASAALMGSESRKSYTVMGDTVNFGARLEPACRDYGVHILISDNTYRIIQADFHCRCIDKLVVKGKTVPIPVYELVSLRDSKTAQEVLDCITLYEEALTLHWDRDWDGALARLEELLAINSDDGPAKLLQERIIGYKITPPPAEWDGAFVRIAK